MLAEHFLLMLLLARRVRCAGTPYRFHKSCIGLVAIGICVVLTAAPPIRKGRAELLAALSHSLSVIRALICKCLRGLLVQNILQ